MAEVVAFLLPFLPLLALLVCLLLGRYPGHAAVVRLSERLGARRRHRLGRAAGMLAGWSQRHAAHGGLLLAHASAGRAPPAQG
jgi:hypothetical protein